MTFCPPDKDCKKCLRLLDFRSENIKKFYKRMALICHTDKLMQESEKVQKIGEKVVKKLNEWKKRMDNSKIDKK